MFRFFTKQFQIYNDIRDIPVWNFQRAKTDLRYLLILNSYHILPKCNINLYPNYEALLFQIMDEFGIDNEHREYLYKVKEVKLLEIDLLLENRGKTELDIANKQLVELMKRIKHKESADIETIASELFYEKGLDIDLKNMSVYRFYKLIDRYNKEIKQKNLEYKKRKLKSKF